MVQETLLAKCDISMNVDPGDLYIVQNLDIFGKDRRILSWRRHVRSHHGKYKVQRVGKWSPQYLGVLKINTNGSSKGNPRKTEIRGVGREGGM